MTRDDVLGRFDRIKAAGDGAWTARCPAHEDHVSSLSLKHTDDGKWLLKCHAGCIIDTIIAAAGLAMTDLFPPKTERRVAARYDYTDEAGKLLFRAVRFEPKGFAQQSASGAWSLKGVRRVLYRLPAVLAAITAGERVWVVEGEKDADRLVSLGLCATTSPAGAGKWRPEYTESLKGARVVVISDNDDPGRKHAASILAAIPGAVEIRIPGLHEHGDVSDYLSAGGTVEYLLAWADAPPVESKTTPPASKDVARMRSDVQRHQAMRAIASAEHVPLAAVRADIERLRASLVPTLSEDDWRQRLVWRTLTDGSQKLEKCFTNAAVFLQYHEAWRGRIRWNELTRQAELGPGAPIDAPAGPWEDRHTADATVWLQGRANLLVTPQVVPEAVMRAAHAMPFHPVREYLEVLVWDGEPRLGFWLEDLAGVSRSPYASAVGRMWLISAVARAYRPGCKADHVLILEGPQNLGKSSLLSVLADPWFGDELDIMGSKDAAMQTAGVWILEIAELDSLRHSDLSRTKAFITRQTDRFRPPYGRFVEERPRGCVFAGSINDAQYLRDETGNRRFWPVACTEINLEATRGVRDQLWAEAVKLFKEGERWWFADAESGHDAEEEQEKRFQEDSWEERITAALEPSTWKPHDQVTVANVLAAIGVDTAKQDRTAQMRAAACLKRLGRQMVQGWYDGKKLRVWMPKGWKRGN